MYYVLTSDKEILHVEPSLNWGEWCQNMDNRQVAFSRSESGVSVSTIFLGLAASWGGKTPLLFETMVFGIPGEHDSSPQAKRATWEEAVQMHNQAKAEIQDLVDGCEFPEEDEVSSDRQYASTWENYVEGSVNRAQIELNSIRCPICQRVSYSLGDIENEYCGSCQRFHRDMFPALTDSYSR